MPEERPGGAAKEDGLEWPPAADSAREFDDLPERCPELHLVDAGPFDASGETEEPRPRRVGSARGGECRTSIGHDPEDVDQRLDVVDDGRLPEQPPLYWERRL